MAKKETIQEFKRTYQVRIRELREDHDLSQSEVAKYLNIAQTTYSEYERGRVRIPVDSLIALAKLYRVDMNHICGYAG